ncbi:unnamed protein product [Moneuplotes crassus]|uniref:Protein farnesyltransferase subunit beta n=2 Tax=Euplotes crassus TaxID=5936 RepID=A0AAD1XCC8_EUPCR|nr:unnamed protein product [Moneuplotes crassus]
MASLSESLKDLQELIAEFYELADYTPLGAKEYNEKDMCNIDKGTHAQFALNNILSLNYGYQSVDSGSPWLPYWLTNILEITMNPIEELPSVLRKKLTKFLKNLHNDESGGFRGQISLQSHIASTYGGLMAIVNIGTEEAYQIIDKQKMKEFLTEVFCKVKQEPSSTLKSSEMKVGENGAYIMHENGEYDLRACYCALIIADILGFLPDPDLTEGMSDLIASCQTYEGGIACNPYGEAHAGYTYCGLSCMILLGEVDKLNLDRLIEWAVNRQLEMEGGFNGRINKLVDSCYNFWMGAIFEMVDMATKGKANIDGQWLCSQLALQGYSIFCCQSSEGGFKDKPRKGVDVYHTMYALAGTSICQHKSHFHQKKVEEISEENKEDDPELSEGDDFDEVCILSKNYNNLLARLSPIYNARMCLVKKAKEFYKEN